MFYQIDQNNSGGHFTVDDKVCHRLFIEADSLADAMDKAEELGCYWNGVAKGFDCPCCGDRWCGCDEVDIENLTTQGYGVSVYGGIYKSAETKWYERFGDFEIVEAPTWRATFGGNEYAGIIKFHNIEEYAQYLANDYGWTAPDVRIYYKDGTVKEIYTAPDAK